MRTAKPLVTLALSVVSVLCATALPVQAQCLNDAQVADMAQHYFAKTPVANAQNPSVADAACTRAKFQAPLGERLGKAVGYKAGLTNPAVQKRFATDQPVWGVLYADMLLPGASTVNAAFGTRPLFEADMLVRVRSSAVNQAQTPMEVLAAIDQVIPFIELPDLLVQAPAQLNGAGLAAINVGARLGVVGTPMPVPRTRAERYALLDALQGMEVVLSDDASGAALGRGKGSDILGHPLNAVVWLAGALAQEGKALQPGDLVSLGSFSPLLPPKPGQAVTVHYHGLPGAAPVRVQFQ